MNRMPCWLLVVLVASASGCRSTRRVEPLEPTPAMMVQEPSASAESPTSDQESWSDMSRTGTVSPDEASQELTDDSVMRPVSYQESVEATDTAPLAPDTDAQRGTPPVPSESDALPSDSMEVPPVQSELDESAEEVPASETQAALTPDPRLGLDDVLGSVANHYPLLEVAMAEQQIATGRELSAWGEFDTNAKAYSLAAPMGYYQNYRSLIALEQPVFCGGYVYSGYKIGDGKFQPWYKERETNEGGEFSLGMGVPLWQNRSIDKRRSAVWQANLARRAVEPAVESQWLDFSRVAAQTYWSWVAAGFSLQAQERLLQLAQQRVTQVEERVRSGDLERIASIDNQRLIAGRETKRVETERKFQESSIKLSLFHRDAGGQPLRASREQLPSDFPTLTVPDEQQLEADQNAAVAARPELRELDLTVQQLRVELAQARNQLQPKLDATVLASQDVGGQTSSLGDKTPFELEAGLVGEVPLQRREARGKIQSTTGKLRQLQAKREFVIDKTVAAVRDAYSALRAAANRSQLAAKNVELAQQSLELGRTAFAAGDVDLIVLNIYEQAVTDAELVEITARADYFAALADYYAILARDPLTEWTVESN